MKRKIFNVLFALVLLLGMSLVMAAPTAADVSTPTVALSSSLAAAADVQYTISFDLGLSLSIGNTITLTFNSAYTIPTTFADNDVTVDGAAILGASVAGDNTAKTIVITLPSAISTSTNPVVVVITSAANLANPVAGAAYTISVKTTAETTAVPSATYAIIALPTVTSVSPAAGNVGDTMWVEVTGTGFTGTATACTTTFSFGAGASVVSGSYHWISATSIDCQITITAAGTLTVSVTTAAGTGTVTGTFTANAANTKQVDVWDSYTPSDTTFTAGTLALQAKFTTLTAAVAAATTSDIVIAHAATYSTGETFPIIIDKLITLKSMSGAASTIIGPPDTQANPNNIVDTAALMVPLMVTHADVTIGGSGAGFTIITRAVAGIWAPNTGGSATGLQILYNTFQAVTQGEARGIWLEATFQADATQNAIIDHNDFSQATGYSATGGQGAPGTGILIVKTALGSSTRALITNNTAANQRYAFLTFKNERKNVLADGPGDETITAGDTEVAGVDVYGNVVHDNGEAMEFARKGDTQDLTIGTNLVKVYKNQLYGNGEGIRIVAAGGTSSTVNGVDKIKIESNDIYSNTKTCAWWQRNGYGVENGQSTAVDAQYNWWGSIGGPAAGTGVTAFGAGDKVSTYVTYDPWLTVTYATYVAGGIRSYGSDAIALQAGWNTLSVPTVLKTSADTFGEIEGIGTFLASLSGTGYWYNAATSTWVSVNTTTQLLPGRGFYINMSAASKFPVLFYDSALGTPPSYSLTAGWNFVGSMFGVDTDSDFGVALISTTNGQKAVNVALASLGTAASNVISPSVPGQVAAWSVLATSTNNMQVGEAYWVFMSASGTLAGFEVTPYYFTWAAPSIT